jgi:hypothetical protein
MTSPMLGEVLGYPVDTAGYTIKLSCPSLS